MNQLKKRGAEMNIEKTIKPNQSVSRVPEDHLCYIVSQGFNITDEQSYLSLISNPKYRCGHCDRQATSDRNLCVPKEL